MPTRTSTTTTSPGCSCCRRTGRSSPTCRFADLVLWLPDREGTGFWAGGQMRPTTGPTAYVDDIVGTFVPAGRRPHLDTAYAEGRLVREGDPEWRDDVPVRVETIPVRRGRPGDRRGRPQHQPARRPHPEPAGAVLPADRRRPDPDDRRRPLPGARGSAATTPTPRGSATASCASTSRAGSSTPARTRSRSTAGSASPATSTGCRLSEVTRELVPPRLRPDEETLSAVLGGRANRDAEIGTDAVVADRPRHPAASARAADRCAGAGPRRHRPAPPRPRAGHQGRHHPRDPPPGEEQPADGRRAAAAAGPPDGQRRRQGGARGGGPPGRLDRDRARDAQPGGRGERRLRRRRRPARRDGRRRGRRSAAGCGYAARARSACCPRRRRPRWRWC